MKFRVRNGERQKSCQNKWHKPFDKTEDGDRRSLHVVKKWTEQLIETKKKKKAKCQAQRLIVSNVSGKNGKDKIRNENNQD